MSTKAGQLLWNRARIIIPVVGGSVVVDTGIRQVNQALEGEPSLASRLMIIPLVPTAGWSGVTHTDPVVGPNGTLLVTFSKAGLQVDLPLNVLFWDPHTLVGPGVAAPYNP